MGSEPVVRPALEARRSAHRFHSVRSVQAACATASVERRSAATHCWSNCEPAEALELGHGGLGGHRGLVAVAARHRLGVGVGDVEDARLERDRIRPRTRRDSPRRRRARGGGAPTSRSRRSRSARGCARHARRAMRPRPTRRRWAAHLGEDLVVDVEVADIVQQARRAHLRDVLARQAEQLGDGRGELGDRSRCGRSRHRPLTSTAGLPASEVASTSCRRPPPIVRQRPGLELGRVHADLRRHALRGEQRRVGAADESSAVSPCACRRPRRRLRRSGSSSCRPASRVTLCKNGSGPWSR